VVRLLPLQPFSGLGLESRNGRFKRWIGVLIAMALMAGGMAPPAAAALVTYNFTGADVSNTSFVTGSFVFDTSLDAITGASMVSTGTPTEIWTWSNPPGIYDGVSFNAFDLVFRSPSAAFPVATFPLSQGDIFAMGFDSPLDGLNADTFAAVYEITFGFLQSNGGTITEIADDLVLGCAAPDFTSCAPVAVPEPTPLALIIAGLTMLLGLIVAGRLEDRNTASV
jgi:hypothetical protein